MREKVLTQSDSRITNVALVGFFTLLMVLSAYVRVPLFITPVPLTMQTLVLYMSIVVLRERASLSQILYVLLGVAGIPVFANAGAGLMYFFGPTGGYLLGFIFVAALAGHLFKKGQTFSHYVLFFTVATAIVYALGVSWLIGFYRLSPGAAIAAGVIPFIPGAVIKITLASLFAAKYK
jgi:biotin transport system substrate-specific component